jgi:hypothetical protein
VSLIHLFFNKRSKKLDVDKEIRSQQPGCTWKTFNLVRGSSTSNMKLHVQKHGIANSVSVSAPGQRSISAIWKHRAERLRALIRQGLKEISFDGR